MEELVELNLSWSGISEEGMKELAGAFRYNPNLKIINLSGNSLKIDGAVALAVVCHRFFDTDESGESDFLFFLLANIKNEKYSNE